MRSIWAISTRGECFAMFRSNVARRWWNHKAHNLDKTWISNDTFSLREAAKRAGYKKSLR